MSDLVIARKLTELERRLDNIARPEHRQHHMARVYRNSTQNINNMTWTAISFNVERFDYGGLWDVANPTRLTAPSSGVYLVTGHIGFLASAVGVRLASLRIQGSTYIGQHDNFAPSGVYTCLFTLSSVWRFTAGQYVELLGWQNTGGAHGCNYSNGQCPELSMSKIG